MKDFFLIGHTGPSFRSSYHLTALPQFKGLVLPEGQIPFNRFAAGDHQVAISRLKTVSLGGFYNHARKNPGTTLVSFYDLSSGHMAIKKLDSIGRYNIEIRDHYNFFLEHNIPFMFVPSRDERETILNARKEWAEFRSHLTDDFSRQSLDCYLAAIETKDMTKMIPVFVDTECIYFNRLSRKFSLVPELSEVYVDIGAWDGDTVSKFVDCAGTYKAIYAFEPFKKAFAILKERQFYLDNFYPYDLAVSNFTGELELVQAATSSRTPSENLPEGAAIEKVSCTKLDDLVDEATLIKVETEGHEVAALEGAANLIRKCKPDMVVQCYHYPLDPIRILEQVNKIHKYKHIAIRFYSVDAHCSSVLFSDRAPFS